MSYLIEATLAYLDEKKKDKKTKEPRWQDSDGDGKWYEPGDDVKVKKESVDGDSDLFDIVMEYLMNEYEGLDEETAAEVMSDLDEDEISYIEELYKGKHGQSDSEYQAGRSDAGKRISGDEKTGPRHYTLGSARGAKVDPPTAPGAKPVNTPKLSSSEKEYHMYNKNSAKNRVQYNKVGGSKGLPG